MATTFPTPPTFASPVVVNPQTGENQFNPMWLQWFLVLASFLTNSQAGRIRDFIPVTSTGVYQPSNGTNNILALAWGAGGGGGASVATAANQISGGGGGGAGGFAFQLLTTGFTGQTFTVGAAGGPGANGGDTAFVSLTARGGKAGVAGTAVLGNSFTPGGLGGASVGSAITGYGQKGGQAILLTNSAGASGTGADSIWGNGGQPALVTGNGSAAVGFVAGGSGALSFNSSGGFVGGSGGGGVGLIVELS